MQEYLEKLKALSDAMRLRIVHLLIDKNTPLCVSEFTDALEAPQYNVSRHLKILKNARLVERRRDGVRIYYRLADKKVFNCWKGLQSLAENRVAEIRGVLKDFLSERDAMNAMSKEELWSRLKSNDVILLDVRPEEEFISGHISGAISIPLSELRERLNEIPHDHEVVVYCRGPYCVLSPEAVKILHEEGYAASRLEDGLPEGIEISNMKEFSGWTVEADKVLTF